MNKWSKETQEKLDECVINICNSINEYIDENSLVNIQYQIKDNIEEFAEYLHNKTCNEMIDID